MSDVDGTCEYVLDPGDPETWGGKEGELCFIDEDVTNQEGVWACPHTAEPGENLCIFHLPPNKKDNEEVIEEFLSKLNEADGADNPNKKCLEFLGSYFGKFDLSDNPPDIAVENETFSMSYSKINGIFDLSSSTIRIPSINLNGIKCCDAVNFQDSEFGGNTHFLRAVVGKVADFQRAQFDGNVHFQDAEFGELIDYHTAADLRYAEFGGDTRFNNVKFFGDSLFHGTQFGGEASFDNAEFRSDTDFRGTKFNKDAQFRDAVFTGDVLFNDTDFREVIDFNGAEIGGNTDFADIRDNEDYVMGALNIDETQFGSINISDAILTNATLCEVDLESALLSRATLFGADLRGAKLSGAVLGDVRIDEDTKFLGHPSDDGDTSPHTLSAIRSQPTCVYDPDYEEDNEHADVDKAKSVYRALEELGGKHARPRLQARSFVRRQDLQKKDYWDDATADDATLEERLIAGARWSRARVARATLLYGESPWRVIAWSLGIIFSFALLYPLGGWMKAEEASEPLSYSQIPVSFLSEPLGWLGGFLNILADSLYYSTLTYTALGFGDFQPEGFGRLLTTVETGLGAVMLALLVFILGRRAAR